MGKKKRIMFNPKFAHLRKARFGFKSEEEPKSNLEEQQKIEEQEPIEETPVLKMVEEQVKAEKEEEPVVPKNTPARKKKPTIKAKTPKTRAKKTTSKK